MNPTVRPVDLLVAAYNLVLAAVWARLADAAWYAAWIAAAHTLAAGLPLVLRGLARPEPARRGAVARACRELYPLLGLLPFWTELGSVQALSRGPTWDAAVARLDLALFGRHLNLVWMPAMPAIGISELMHFSYFAYYPLIFLPPLAMYVLRRDAALRDMTLRLMVTYLCCYLLYLAYPVIGPAELLPQYQGDLTGGLFYGLTHAARAAGDSLGTAFPSSHAAGATTIAVLAWRWLPRPLAWAIAVQSAAVLLATVYTQNHYPVDTVAGLLWALGLQLLVVPAAQGALSRPLLPVLPVRFGALAAPLTGDPR